jgi:hypothetical protein
MKYILSFFALVSLLLFTVYGYRYYSPEFMWGVGTGLAISYFVYFSYHDEFFNPKVKNGIIVSKSEETIEPTKEQQPGQRVDLEV